MHLEPWPIQAKIVQETRTEVNSDNGAGEGWAPVR